MGSLEFLEDGGKTTDLRNSAFCSDLLVDSSVLAGPPFRDMRIVAEAPSLNTRPLVPFSGNEGFNFLFVGIHDALPEEQPPHAFIFKVATKWPMSTAEAGWC